MARSKLSRRLLLLVLCTWGVGPASRCQAQFYGGGGFSDAFSNVGPSGLLNTGASGQGGWAEILTVTPKWLVIQNAQGQQFPVALSGIKMFVIRWPGLIEKLAPGTLIEATGLDVGTNRVQTDHVDAYEGTANQLGITPTVETIVGYNRVLNAFDIEQHNTYGIDYFRLLTPAELTMPRRLHVVGPIIGINPLRLGSAGGIPIIVAPSANSLAVSSITPGSSSLVKAGDLAYVVPMDATPRSLNLSQLVVYKKVTQAQFAP